MIKDAQYLLTDSQLVDVQQGKLSNITIKTSIPIDSSLLSSSPKAEIVSDEDQNLYLELSIPNPLTPLSYNHTLNLSVSEKTTSELGSAEQILSSVDEISPKYLDVKDANVLLSLAQNITHGKESDFEKISSLAIWVNQNIDYNLSDINSTKEPLTILERGSGVCSDLTTLFVSLCRSIGYPARFVDGFAYSSDESDWVPHSWAEVYLGKWVSVDPTWLESGRIDAAHIPFRRGSERTTSLASISVYLSPPGAKLIWSGEEHNEHKNNNIILNDANLIELDSNYDFGVSSSTLPPNASMLFYLGYQGIDYRLVDANLLSCSDDGQGIFNISNENNVIITNPKKVKYLIWEAKTRDYLDSDMIFSCPVLLHSKYLSSQARSIQITDNVIFWPKIDARPRYNPLPEGEIQTIYADSNNKLAKKTFTLLTDNFRINTVSDFDGTAKLSFKQESVGDKIAYIFSEAGDYQKTFYRVTPKAKSIYSSIFIVNPAYVHENTSLIFELIDASMLDEDKVYELEIREPYSTNSYTLKYPFVGNYSFDTIFNKSTSSYVRINILDSGDTVFEQNELVNVLSRASAWVENINVFNYEDDTLMLELTVGSSSSTKRIFLIIDGNAYPIKTGVSRFVLPKGDYDAKLGWSDEHGSYMQLDFNISSPTAEDPLFTGETHELYSHSTLYSAILTSAVIILIMFTVLEYLHKNSYS
jgi:hypothetical protein